MSDRFNTNSDVWIAVSNHAKEQLAHYRSVLEDPDCSDKNADIARGVILGMKSVLNLTKLAPRVSTIDNKT